MCLRGTLQVRGPNLCVRRGLHTRKRGLHTRKRGLHTRKRGLYTRKRGLQTRTRGLYGGKEGLYFWSPLLLEFVAHVYAYTPGVRDSWSSCLRPILLEFVTPGVRGTSEETRGHGLGVTRRRVFFLPPSLYSRESATRRSTVVYVVHCLGVVKRCIFCVCVCASLSIDLRRGDQLQ